MDKKKFVIISESVRIRVIDFVKRVQIEQLVEVVFRPADKRTLAQNALLWPLLKDVSNQVNWHGYRLSSDEWKDVFSGSLSGELKVVPNLSGTGFVMLGLRTSKMSKKKFSAMIELIYCFGAEKGVRWSEKAQTAYAAFLGSV